MRRAGSRGSEALEDAGIHAIGYAREGVMSPWKKRRRYRVAARQDAKRLAGMPLKG